MVGTLPIRVPPPGAPVGPVDVGDGIGKIGQSQKPYGREDQVLFCGLVRFSFNF